MLVRLTFRSSFDLSIDRANVSYNYSATATGSNCKKITWEEYSNPCLKVRDEDDLTEISSFEVGLEERAEGPGCPSKFMLYLKFSISPTNNSVGYTTYSDITCYMTAAVMVQLEINDSEGIPVAIGWLDVSASFEGSESSLTCDEFINTVNSFLTPVGSALSVIDTELSKDAADLIGDIGSVQTLCDDIKAITSWFDGA
jgi:hypothetical protein